MEARIFDLKQSLNPNNYNSKTQELPKTKDFSSTLDSINNKNQINRNIISKKDYGKDSKTPIKSKELETKEEIEDETLEMEDEDNYIPAYNTPLFLLANLKENLEEFEIDEEELRIFSDIIPNLSEVKDIVIEENIEEAPIEELLTNIIIATDEFQQADETEIIYKNNAKNINKSGFDQELEPHITDKTIVDSKTIVDTKATRFETSMNNNDLVEEGLIVGNEIIANIDPLQDEEGFTNLKNKFTKEEIVLNEDSRPVDNGEKDFAISFEKDVVVIPSEYGTEVEKPEIVNKDQLINQILEKAKFSLNEGKNEIRIILKPESLGEMTMSLEVVKNNIVAKIMVDNHRTKEIIENNLNQLKDGLKDTQLEIKTFEVFVGSGSDFEKHNTNGFNLYQNSKKIRLKPEEKNATKNYLDNSLIDSKEIVDFYADNSVNLFA